MLKVAQMVDMLCLGKAWLSSATLLTNCYLTVHAVGNVLREIYYSHAVVEWSNTAPGIHILNLFVIICKDNDIIIAYSHISFSKSALIFFFYNVGSKLIVVKYFPIVTVFV